MNEIYFFAKHYRKFGFNVTCSSKKVTEYNFYCKSRLKAPSHKWDHLFSEEQSEEEFNGYLWEDATGVGYASGFNNIRTIDIDGCSSYEILYEVLEILKLPKNYQWVLQSGGRNGFHIIVEMGKYTKLALNDAVSTYMPLKHHQHLFKKIEILWECNSMLPPSIHPSTNRYSFINNNLPQQAPLFVELADLSNFIKIYFSPKAVISSSYGINLPHSNLPKYTTSPSKELNDDSLYLSHMLPLFMIVDIETDGLIEEFRGNIKYPNVLQIAWVIMDNEAKIINSESRIINSGLTSNRAFHINHLDISTINQVGITPQEAYVSFIESLKNVKYIIAHNIEFDISIIENELSKYNLPKIPNDIKRICTMKSSIDYCQLPGGYPYRFPKLPELYNFLFGTKFSALHNAEADALATTMCFRQMIRNSMIEF